MKVKSLLHELRRIWKNEIEPHFKEEEEKLMKGSPVAGRDMAVIVKLLHCHRTMEMLVWKDGQENVLEFAKCLEEYLSLRRRHFPETVETP